MKLRHSFFWETLVIGHEKKSLKCSNGKEKESFEESRKAVNSWWKIIHAFKYLFVF